MSVKRAIPNALTLLGLFCGCLAIYEGCSERFDNAGYLIFIAALLDFLDGTAARVLNARSAIGAQLDSLADAVSFGAAPGLLLFSFVNRKAYLFDNTNLENEVFFVMVCMLTLPPAAAWRLARFNVEPGDGRGFTGLPTPAMAVFVACIPFMQESLKGTNFELALFNSFTFVGVALALSLLMVSRFPLLAFKHAGGPFVASRYLFQFIWLGAAVPLVFFLRYNAAVPLMLLYLAFSGLDAWMRR